MEPRVQVLEFTDGTLSPERLEDLSKDTQPAGSKVTSRTQPLPSLPRCFLFHWSLSSKPGVLYVPSSCLLAQIPC